MTGRWITGSSGRIKEHKMDKKIKSLFIIGAVILIAAIFITNIFLKRYVSPSASPVIEPQLKRGEATRVEKKEEPPIPKEETETRQEIPAPAGVVLVN